MYGSIIILKNIRISKTCVCEAFNSNARATHFRREYLPYYYVRYRTATDWKHWYVQHYGHERQPIQRVSDAGVVSFCEKIVRQAQKTDAHRSHRVHHQRTPAKSVCDRHRHERHHYLKTTGESTTTTNPPRVHTSFGTTIGTIDGQPISSPRKNPTNNLQSCK